jgi:hypothetical protein
VSIEAMKQALEVLSSSMYPQPQQMNAIDTLRQAIAEAEKQEPVAYIQTNRHCEEELVWDKDDELENGLYSYTPLYTSPPQRQPLTDEMTKQMRESCDSYEMRGAFVDGWLSAEAAHGIKGEA